VPDLNIELIVIGDEVLLGHTQDTNSHWIAGALSGRGLRLRWMSVVGDKAGDMRHQIRRAWNRSEVVIITGGLGPTHDDITRPVIARFFNDELVPRSDLAKLITNRFALRGLTPPPGSERMAEFPSRAEPIPNQHGSAPGMHYQQDGKHLFALPGVPVEMRGMMEGYVLPRLESLRKGYFGFRIFRTAGIGESYLSRLIGDETDLAPVHLAYLPSIDQGVILRLSLSDDDESTVNGQLNKAADYVRGRVQDYIYAEDERSLEEVILTIMRAKKQTLAVAESCTGGLIAHRIVSVAGSSDVFERGLVTYSNRAKIELLGVNPAVLNEFGAVSRQVAEAMAEGARLKSGVDMAVSVTGIAGPSGGTPDKPVGLVWIALDDSRGTISEKYLFAGSRDSNRRRAAGAALTMLWKRVR